MKKIPDLPNHYARLGGWRVMSALELKALYRPLARAHHPDKGGSEELFKLLSEADGVLQDNEARTTYNAQLALTAPVCGACKGEGCVYRQKGFTQRFAKRCEECAGAGHMVNDVAWRRGS